MNDNDIITFVRPYTAVSEERLRNVLSLVERVITEEIPGDLAEVGVWKGGVLMAMALKCQQLGKTRVIHAYDTFSGMTAPTEHDVDLNGYTAIQQWQAVKSEASLQEVMQNLLRIPSFDIQYHVGDITKQTTFPTFALLRLDTDWYESTKHELTYMEPCVSPNGFVIVDDYGHWKGSRRAVDEFGPPSLHWIDYTGVWWQRDFGRHRLGSSEFERVLAENFHHFIALGPQFHRGCGSYLIDGQRYVYQLETLAKQRALYEVGKTSSHVLEIGVYLGHSLLILLLSNPSLRIVCIDNDSTFSPRAVNYLNSHFGNRITFHLGNSADILQTSGLGMFDCIHIDADHQEEPVRSEFTLTQRLAKPGAWFVFDDYEALRHLIDGWIADTTLRHVDTPGCLWTNIVTQLNNVSS